MSNVLNHQFQSAVADSGDASLVQPSNWNAGHKFSGGTHGNVLMRDTGDATFGASWLPHPSSVVTITTTGTLNNYALGAFGTLRCNNASLLTITGIAAGVDGQLLFIESVGAGQVDLSHQDSGSTAANRLLNFATIGKTSLAPNSGVAIYKYDATTQRWRLLEHVQGALINVAYAGGNYTGSSGSWTVDSGDQAALAYYLHGRILRVEMQLLSTTVSGSPTGLIMAMPGGFSGVGASLPQIGYSHDSGVTYLTGYAVVNGTSITFRRDPFGSGAWANVTNGVNIFANLGFAVS